MSSLTLLANYAATRQHSINLYSDFVAAAARDELSEVQAINVWRPHGLFSKQIIENPSNRLFLDADKYITSPLEACGIRADVLHVVDNSNAWYARFARYRKLIVTCHDLVPWVCLQGRVEGWRPSRAARLLLNANIKMMRKADIVVSVSYETENILKELSFEPDKIRTIQNCIFQDFSVTARAPSDLDADLKRTFVHFGAGKFPKHTELVLAAAEVLASKGRKDIKFLFVGGGAEDLPVAEGCADMIVARRGFALEEIKYLYQNVCGLVMPSRYEGFGLPIIEAQALGCPAIASDGGALAEVAGEGALSLKRPISPEALASVLMRLTDDKAARDDEIKKGYSNAARFSQERATSAYKALYREIFDGVSVR